MELAAEILDSLDGPRFDAWLILLVGFAFAALLSIFSRTILLRITKRTDTDLDDLIVTHARGPMALTIALASVIEASKKLGLPEYYVSGIAKSIMVVAWTLAANKIAAALLKILSRSRGAETFVNARTMPLFEMMAKVVVWGGSAYFFMMVAWGFDPTAWLASAGIAGVAIGFAAKDTLANLFAGVFIIADSPFKMGDFLSLDTGEQGRVTKIGFRATRLITFDDIEIIVPNAIMANARVVNQSGGPYEHVRIKLNVGVAYGSDIDKVRQVLLSVADVANVVHKPEPMVMFKAFGDSSLDFVLMVWVPPVSIPSVQNALNVAIYKAFAENGIQIPFPQRDVHMIGSETD